MTLGISVDPLLLGSAAGTEGAGAASMGAAGSGAAPAITTVLPAGGDSVSAAAAAALNARGAATMGALAEFIAMRQNFAATIGVNGASYAGTEVMNTAAIAI
jgi:PE family